MPVRITLWLGLILAACAAPEDSTDVGVKVDRPAPGREVGIEPAVHAFSATAPGAPDSTAKRAVPALVGVAIPGPPAEKAPSLRKQVRETRVPSFQVRGQESLRELVAQLQAATGLPLVVAVSAEDACFDEGIVFDLDLAHAMRVVDLLNLIVDQADGQVGWSLRHEVVLFTSADKAVAATTVMRMYDVRALTFPRTDFIGPRIDRLRLLDELEDDDGGGPFGGVGETVSQTTPEEIVDQIVAQVAPDSWAADGVSIDHSEGLLIVVQSRQVQGQVRRFLQQIGAF